MKTQKPKKWNLESLENSESRKFRKSFKNRFQKIQKTKKNWNPENLENSESRKFGIFFEKMDSRNFRNQKKLESRIF